LSTSSIAKGDLTAILTNIRHKQVMFFRRSASASAGVGRDPLTLHLRITKLDIISGRGHRRATHTMECGNLHSSAATTRPDWFPPASDRRFGLFYALEFYTTEDLKIIVERSAEILA